MFFVLFLFDIRTFCRTFVERLLLYCFDIIRTDKKGAGAGSKEKVNTEKRRDKNRGRPKKGGKRGKRDRKEKEQRIVWGRGGNALEKRFKV